MPDLVVAGAGMAGLAAAAEARERGAEVLHLEKGDVAGGAMLHSSGVIWRHADWERVPRASARAATRRCSALLFDRLDADLDWLEAARRARDAAGDREPAHGGPPLRHRVDRRRARPATCACGAPLDAAAGRRRSCSPRAASRRRGSCCATHVTPEPLLRRATPWSTGDGLRIGLEAGGACSAGMGEFYGRAMPAAPLARASAGSRTRSCTRRHADGAPTRPASATWRARGRRSTSCSGSPAGRARAPGSRSAREVDGRADAVRDRGGADRPRGGGRRAGAPGPATAVEVHVAAAVTTTLGGLRIDAARARGGRRVGGRRRHRRDGHRRLLQRPGRRARDGPDRRAPRRWRDGDRSGSRTRSSSSTASCSSPTPPRRCCRASTLPEGEAGFEAFACELELRSPPVGHGRGGDRGRCATTARRSSPPARTPLAAGLHPTAELGEARLVDHERYRRVGDLLRGLLTQRSPESALHVHVGMPDPETGAPRASTALRVHLPLLAGLAANSPFWFGRDSGMASARAALVRAYPGRGVPRSFRDLGDYERALEETLRAAGMEDRTQVWWDLRPHARLGTVEVREMDAQTDLRDARGARRADPRARPRRRRARAAGRPVGRGAQLVDVPRRQGRAGRGDPRRARRRAPAPRGRARAAAPPRRRRWSGVERILRDGNGADRQRAVHARDGMPGLLRDLARRTVR